MKWSLLTKAEVLVEVDLIRKNTTAKDRLLENAHFLKINNVQVGIGTVYLTIKHT